MIFSASNASFLDSTLTGPGSGTAIQIASGPSTSLGTGSSATIGPKVTIDNFEKGVFIKTGATAEITQNSIKVKSSLIADAIVFETPISSSAFSESLIGKHLSESDPNYADKFVGALAGKTVDSCVGSVEAIYKEESGQQVTPFDYLATCSVKWIKDDADKVTLKNKDNTTTDIGADSCIFECTGLNAATNYLITFVFTDGNGITNDYLPSTPLVSDLPDVSFITTSPEGIPPSSGATGSENTGSTIYVPPVNPGAGDGTDKIDSEKLFIDTGDQTGGTKKQELADDQNNDDSDSPINATSAPSVCTLITSANSPQAMPLLIWLMGLPAILIRRFKN